MWVSMYFISVDKNFFGIFQYFFGQKVNTFSAFTRVCSLKLEADLTNRSLYFSFMAITYDFLLLNILSCIQ